MEYGYIGNSELHASRLGFGCLALGGHGVGNIDFNELKRAVDLAIFSGINYFDTADIYGLGQSEELLGKWINEKRNDLIISSKFGVRRSDDGNIFYDNSVKWIEEALQSSLRRLKTDYIDLYFLHHYDGITPFEEIFDALEKERKKGKIRNYGVSNVSYDDICEYLSDYPGLVAHQNEFSLVNRENEVDILNFEKNKVSLTAFGCLGQGILTGKYDKNVSFPSNDSRNNKKYINFHEDKLEKNLKILSIMKSFADNLSVSTAQFAIRWILDKFSSSIPILGVKNPSQLEGLLYSTSFIIPNDYIKELDFKISQI